MGSSYTGGQDTCKTVTPPSAFDDLNQQIYIMEFREACEQGDFERASDLLRDESIDPNRGWSRRNITPLHLACRYGALDFVKLLIETYKINPEITLHEQHMETPLHLAAVEGHLSVVKYLTNEAGCNPDVRSHGYQRPPITYACGFADFPPHYSDEADVLEVVKYLCESCSCNPHWVDAFGMTALHNACANRNVSMVKYLLSKCNCDPSLRDNHGNTALHLTSRQFPFHNLMRPTSAAVEIIRLLVLHYNCDPHLVNNANFQPIDYTDEPELVAELVGYGTQGRKAAMYKKHNSFMGHTNRR